MSRASSLHEAELDHGDIGELRTFDRTTPFKRGQPLRTASTSHATLEDAGSTGQQVNPTPTYIPATFETASPLQRLGSRKAAVGTDTNNVARTTSGNPRLVQSRSRDPATVRPGRQRGLSLVEAAANIAVAGFGLGESDQEVVQRTLSRVSTHRSYQAPFAAIPHSTTSKTQRVTSDDDADARSGSDRTIVDAREVGDAGVGFNGGEGGEPLEHDLEKASRSQEAQTATTEKEMTEDELFMVTFEPDEKANPKNWSVAYRWYITGLGSLLVLNSTFASSAPSGIITQMEEYFGFSQEVAILTVSLFVAGYCVGPLLWGPLSESYGRRPIFLIAFLGYIGFQVGCALSKNVASILIFRFLGGVFASCPLTNAGALLADIWDADRRGIAMSLFGLAPFAGPATAPMIAGYIGVSGASWRWLYWVLCFFASVCGLGVLFTLPETYTPILLVKKAQILRKETGDERWWAPLERKEKDFKTVARDVLVKPFKILFLEPMLIAITVYMSFVYGCLYLLFEAYPIVFELGHGFNAGAAGLMFLGLFVGGAMATLVYITVFDGRYKRRAEPFKPAMAPPELRLELAILASPLFAVSFFWFGWTSFPSVHWASPMCAGGLLGFSVLGIFVSMFNYIVDTYLFAAASALSANTVCRSIFGAVFPLFATQMFLALNPRWASTLLGCVALIMVPIPLVLIKYGPTLRAKSRFSPNKK